jgi:predicted DCC family thiol-disulfide oxidoreductase YuxK
MKGAQQKNNPNRTVLIYDASCPICSHSIGWIEDNARENAFEMLGCRSEAVKKRFPNIPEADCMQAMQLVLPDGSVLPGEKALPEIFRRLKRYRKVGDLFKIPGSENVSRNLYRWFADHRYHIAKLLFPRARGDDNKAA